MTELAVELVEEVEPTLDQPANADDLLRGSILYLAELRREREGQKLIAQSRRTDAELGEQDQVSLLQKLTEQARQPNLRRVGS